MNYLVKFSENLISMHCKSIYETYKENYFFDFQGFSVHPILI